MISQYKNNITSGTRYPKKFIDECAKRCFWVKGYDRALCELGKDGSVPKLSSFLGADLEGSVEESGRFCDLRNLYLKSLTLEKAMCEVELAQAIRDYSNCFPIEISMSESTTHYIPIRFMCKLCNQPFKILDAKDLLKALADHHNYHRKINCKHSLSERFIEWETGDHGDLEITKRCGQCGKTLEGYATNIEDIKELLFNTLSSTPHLKINKMIIE